MANISEPKILQSAMADDQPKVCSDAEALRRLRDIQARRRTGPIVNQADQLPNYDTDPERWDGMS